MDPVTGTLIILATLGIGGAKIAANNRRIREIDEEIAENNRRIARYEREDSERRR